MGSIKIKKRGEGRTHPPQQPGLDWCRCPAPNAVRVTTLGGCSVYVYVYLASSENQQDDKKTMNGRGETTRNVDLDWDNTINLEVFPLQGVGDTKDLIPPVNPSPP